MNAKTGIIIALIVALMVMMLCAAAGWSQASAQAGQPYQTFIPGVIQYHTYHASINPTPGAYSLDNFNMSALITLDSGQCYGAWLNFRVDPPDAVFMQYHPECVLSDGKYRASILISFYAPVTITDVYACEYDGAQTYCTPIPGMWSFGR